jgi:hypothetical protein
MPYPTAATPLVHVVSDSPDVQLHEVLTQSTGIVWGYGGGFVTMTTSQPVCSVPCDRVVDAHNGQSFFFRGQGMPASSNFQLAGHGPQVTLDVKAGSSGLRAGGIAMASIGGAAMVIGAITLALGFYRPPTVDSSGNVVDGPPDQGLQLAGGLALGLGVAAVAGGIVMIVKGRTTYSFIGPGEQAKTPLGWTF